MATTVISTSPIALPTDVGELCAEQDVSSAYDGSNVLFRLLRMITWGPGLMNLGYFRFRGPLAFLNLVVNLEKTQRELVLRSLELLGVNGRQDVLDVACGRGKSSFMMHCLNPQARITGMDLLDHNVAAAKLLFGCSPGLNYQQGCAMQLPFDSNRFDRLQCLEAAFHFPDRRNFLQEAFRVLKPGGRMVIVDFAWRSEKDRQTLNSPETQLVRQIWQWNDIYTLDEYHEEARQAGFQLKSSIDWSSKVTGPFQTTFDWLIAFMKRPWLKRRAVKINPLLGTLSDADWRELETISRAQDFVRKRSKYMAFVFEKP